MPTFNRDALRKGRTAIDEAVANRGKGDGNFRPFLPNIFWKNDKDTHYVLLLNAVEESPQVELHPYIGAESGPAMIMARTDPSIGASADPIHVRWGYKPRKTNLAIAVELEPVTKVINGYEKPVGFAVKTREFTRRLRDDDGELTDEREEVIAPSVGLIAQSPLNFFNQLSSYDATEFPVHRTPLKVTQLNEKSDKTFQITGYQDIEVDRTNLLEYIENVSYVTDPEGLLEAISGLDEVEASTVIGDYLLYRRIEELADEDYYNEVLDDITKPNPWAEKDKKDKKDSKPAPRQARPSQRRKTSTEEPVEETPVASEEPGEAKEEKVTRGSTRTKRLEQLKARSRAASKSA